MDPVYYSSVLDSSLRQSTERHWPRPQREREMVAWSTAPARERRSLLSTVRSFFRALLGSSRVAGSEPTPASANDI